MAGEAKANRPAVDEVEVSLFGPGFGECIAIHLGDNRWITVDSCTHPFTKRPAVLDYFDLLGVNPAEDVTKVIATHWHDDHVRGLSDLYSACTSADFICSNAVGSKEFLTLLETHKNLMMEMTSGLSEFQRILSTHIRRTGGPPAYACVDRRLFHATVAEYPCTITALSPSDHAYEEALRSIGALIPVPNQPKRRLSAFHPNHAAVVLWVSVGNLSILLGADLEEQGSRHTGWSAIIGSNLRPEGKASLYKVAHHGSKTGHHPDIWSTLLDNTPVAVLTPFERGSVKLPKVEDRDRICQYTDSAYISLASLRQRPIKRDHTTRKFMRRFGLDPKPIQSAIGHVRMRARQGQAWQVELFDGACHLTDFADE